jgi:hypothetical protein
VANCHGNALEVCYLNELVGIQMNQQTAAHMTVIRSNLYSGQTRWPVPTAGCLRLN